MGENIFSEGEYSYIVYKTVMSKDGRSNHIYSENLLQDLKDPRTLKMVLTQYTYVFAFGTMFALLEAFNNGASTSPMFF
jgi:hypothetical protein